MIFIHAEETRRVFLERGRYYAQNFSTKQKSGTDTDKVFTVAGSEAYAQETIGIINSSSLNPILHNGDALRQ